MEWLIAHSVGRLLGMIPVERSNDCITSAEINFNRNETKWNEDGIFRMASAIAIGERKCIDALPSQTNKAIRAICGKGFWNVIKTMWLAAGRMRSVTAWLRKFTRTMGVRAVSH